MYKYGVVSTASITKRFIDGLRQAGDEVICIGSRDINKAKRFAEENNIKRYYESYDEVYKDNEIDIVYIPVINNLHYICARNALLHKKHVVLEKPFTTNKEEAQELFRIAKDNNCFLFEGVKNLFVPSTKFIKDNLYKIGKVTNIVTSQGIKTPFQKGHWMYDITKGGGAYFGSMAYVFHYLRHIFNAEVSDLDGDFIPINNTDLKCNFYFNLNKDIRVYSTIDMSKDLDNKCIIEGTNGKIIIDVFWRSHHVEIITNDNHKYEFNDSGNEFIYETKHIQECLNKGLIESPLIQSKDSIKEVEEIIYLYKKWNLL